MKLDLPFAFTSGYGEPVAFAEEYANIAKLRKPYSLESLRALLALRREPS